MAKLEHNTEARKAWCLRHGLDPSTIVDEPYPGMKLPDGRILYELTRFEGIDDSYSSPGEAVTSHIGITVSGDDPIPPQYLITGLPDTVTLPRNVASYAATALAGSSDNGDRYCARQIREAMGSETP